MPKLNFCLSIFSVSKKDETMKCGAKSGSESETKNKAENTFEAIFANRKNRDNAYVHYQTFRWKYKTQIL